MKEESHLIWVMAFWIMAMCYLLANAYISMVKAAYG